MLSEVCTSIDVVFADLLTGGYALTGSAHIHVMFAEGLCSAHICTLQGSNFLVKKAHSAFYFQCSPGAAPPYGTYTPLALVWPEMVYGLKQQSEQNHTK